MENIRSMAMRMPGFKERGQMPERDMKKSRNRAVFQKGTQAVPILVRSCWFLFPLLRGLLVDSTFAVGILMLPFYRSLDWA